MISDQMTGIEEFEAGLWKITDDLRANSGLASNEYFMPIMGLLFLRQATNRYYEALAAMEADQLLERMMRTFDRELLMQLADLGGTQPRRDSSPQLLPKGDGRAPFPIAAIQSRCVVFLGGGRRRRVVESAAKA